jgi:zinc transport system substrate-binding protein
LRYTISLAVASLLTTTAAVADAPRVVTDIPPVHSLVAQVMGDLGTPELLLDRGASEHSFQLRPSQAAGLQDAGLVVWVGPELTPWLDTALEAAPDSVPRLALLTVEGTALRDYAEGAAHDHGDDHGHDHAEGEAHDHGHDHAEGEAHDHGHDHAEGEAHDHGHDHDHAEAGAEAHDHGHDHAHTGTDPHAWMDPGNAQVWLAAIAAELSRLDPANAATYAANADAAALAVGTLDAEVAATLAPVADAPLVMFHDAYGYLAAHYGLNIAGTVALGDAASPGAARLRELQATVAEGGAICLFPEAQHAPDLLTQMAEGTGAVIGGTLDPVGSTMEPGPGMYADWLRGMAAAIAACATPA